MFASTGRRCMPTGIRGSIRGSSSRSPSAWPCGRPSGGRRPDASWAATVVLSTAGVVGLGHGARAQRRPRRPGAGLRARRRVPVRRRSASMTSARRCRRSSTASHAVHPENWNVHVAGHPPGALLSFVLLDRIGISDPFWVSVTVVTLGATGVAAVLLTLDAPRLARARPAGRALGGAGAVGRVGRQRRDPLGRGRGVGPVPVARCRAAPGGRLSAAVRRGRLVLGLSLFLSYGLVLFGLLPLAVFALTRAWRLLPWAGLGRRGRGGGVRGRSASPGGRPIPCCASATTTASRAIARTGTGCGPTSRRGRSRSAWSPGRRFRACGSAAPRASPLAVLASAASI